MFDSVIDYKLFQFIWLVSSKFPKFIICDKIRRRFEILNMCLM